MDNNQPKYKVWWDEDNQIIRAKFVGEQDEANAQGTLEEVQKIIASKPGESSLLIDLIEAGSASSGARKKFAEMEKIEKIKKEAQFGAGIVARVVASFIVKFSGSNARMFATEAEALAWLKEK